MYNSYVVKANDTIESIALMFNTTPSVLQQLNNYDLNMVAGATILVPMINSPYFDYYTVKKGDTLYNIATSSSLTPTLLAMLNGLNVDDYIYPNQVLLIPKAGSILYITASGDTLNDIANGFNVGVSDLLEQNNNLYLQPEQLIVYKYE